jgi:3-oxoacid CoA-transferase subunit A
VLIEALLESGVTELEAISNNAGVDDWGLGRLLSAGRLRRVTASYVGENKEFERQYLSGELEVELTPQGTLAERMRAGGSGIAAFFTMAGAGTQVAEGGLPWRYDRKGQVVAASPAKETRTYRTPYGSKEFVLEEAIFADFGLVRAAKGDRHGNLVFRDSARNFNPLAAMCGRITIAEVEELVEPGEIDPNEVHTPSVFVQRVVALSAEQVDDKRIEKRTTRTRPEVTQPHPTPPLLGFAAAVPPQAPGLMSSAFQSALIALTGPMERVGMNAREWFDVIGPRQDDQKAGDR